jgi:hypothetical protein
MILGGGGGGDDAGDGDRYTPGGDVERSEVLRERSISYARGAHVYLSDSGMQTVRQRNRNTVPDTGGSHVHATETEMERAYQVAVAKGEVDRRDPRESSSEGVTRADYVQRGLRVVK